MIGAVVCGVLASTVASPAFAYDDTRYTTPKVAKALSNVYLKSCFDADGDRTRTNGAKVQLYKCHQGTNQNWRFEPDLTNGGYRIKLDPTGMCLDADTSTLAQEVSRVQLWTCNGQRQQLWDLRTATFAGLPNFVGFIISNRLGTDDLRAAGNRNAMVVLEVKYTSDLKWENLRANTWTLVRAPVQLRRIAGDTIMSNQAWYGPPVLCAYNNPRRNVTIQGSFSAAACA